MGRAEEEVLVNEEPHGIAGHTLMEISRELTFRLTHTHTTEEDALSCVFSQAVKELSLVRKIKLYRIKRIGLYSKFYFCPYTVSQVFLNCCTYLMHL